MTDTKFRLESYEYAHEYELLEHVRENYFADMNEFRRSLQRELGAVLGNRVPRFRQDAESGEWTAQPADWKVFVWDVPDVPIFGAHVFLEESDQPSIISKGILTVIVRVFGIKAAKNPTEIRNEIQLAAESGDWNLDVSRKLKPADVCWVSVELDQKSLVASAAAKLAQLLICITDVSGYSAETMPAVK